MKKRPRNSKLRRNSIVTTITLIRLIFLSQDSCCRKIELTNQWQNESKILVLGARRCQFGCTKRDYERACGKVPFNFQTLDVLNLMPVAARGSGAFEFNVLFAHKKYFLQKFSRVFIFVFLPDDFTSRKRRSRNA